MPLIRRAGFDVHTCQYEKAVFGAFIVLKASRAIFVPASPSPSHDVHIACRSERTSRKSLILAPSGRVYSDSSPSY
ncbi:hypothetical protein AMJ40_03410 [candidate division TA06 bacterium DG_26]|uniref:Uncharacterized protein n=1 Tax=candidate division TA06 bacterium DG_26 TaxID=1703771 RepID=A0A0S7WJB8_UNCT6|nr:MAG: hypothetical protein AMJ40_03410 [candidate division TA06 bacterium DG_26]